MPNRSKSYVAGYRYYAGIHFVIARAVDAVIGIDVGEKTAWWDDVTGVASGRFFIDQKDLHGGDDGEGGIQGHIEFLDGNPNQPLNSYMQERLGVDQSSYRGVFSAVWERGLLSARSAYPKPWAFYVRRTQLKCDLTAQWNQAQADINGDMNPAHIVRECLTDTEWGLGVSELTLDEPSFLAAAQTLYDEDFGLSILWSDGEQSIQDFINNILSHVNGALYVDPTSGKFVLKLVRDDYDINTLDVFNEDDIIQIDDVVRSSPGEITTQLEVKYMDPDTFTENTVIVHNLAMADIQGAAIPDSREYLGIRNRRLAIKVASRELRAITALGIKFKVVGNRRMAKLTPGDVFLLEWDAFGVGQMVVRVLEVDYGTLLDGKVTIQCVEDIWGTDDAIYDEAVSIWTSPYTDPQSANGQELFELPYWTVVREIIPESQSTLINPDKTYIQALARHHADNEDDAPNFRIWLNGEDYDLGYFMGSVRINANMDQAETDLQISYTDGQNLDFVEVGQIALMQTRAASDPWYVNKTEIFEVVAIDKVAGNVTLGRGHLDTVPQSWSSGDILWFPESKPSYVTEEFDADDAIAYRVGTRTSNGELDYASATETDHTLIARHAKLFPPGRFRVVDQGTGELTPDGNSSVTMVMTSHNDIKLRWRHRDKTLQTATLISQSDNLNYGPEANTEYVLIFKNGSSPSQVLRTEYVTGNTFTYTEAMQNLDYPSELLTSIDVEIYARDSTNILVTSFSRDVSITRNIYTP